MVSFQNRCNMTGICHNCSKEYSKIVNFYHESIASKKRFLLCLDVEQAINASIHQWNRVFKCKRATKIDRFATFALSAFVILLPLAFYFGVYMQSEERKIEYEFVMRSNFKETDDPDVGASIDLACGEGGRGGGGAYGGFVGGDVGPTVNFYSNPDEMMENSFLSAPSRATMLSMHGERLGRQSPMGSPMSPSPVGRVPSVHT